MNRTHVNFRKPLMLAIAALALSAVAAPASAVTVGATSIDVRSKGALGDGQHDDTAAFQAAITRCPRRAAP